jgi:capsule biosynthesis phosphatase
MKRLVVDLDNTLTIGGDGQSYNSAKPNLPLIEKLREYKSDGFDIVILSARNMRTYEGNIGKINVHTLPVILEWLKRHDVPYDEVVLGKPWCGHDGFYIDDRAIRPDEFVNLTYDEIRVRIGA